MKCAYYRVETETPTHDPWRHLSSNLEQSAVRSDLSLTSHEETLLRITPSMNCWFFMVFFVLMLTVVHWLYDLPLVTKLCIVQHSSGRMLPCVPLPCLIIGLLLILRLLFVDAGLEAVFLVNHNRRLCNSIDTLEMVFDYFFDSVAFTAEYFNFRMHYCSLALCMLLTHVQ